MSKIDYRLSFNIFKSTILIFLTLIILIALLRFHSYILFHTAAEFFSILISFAIFIFAWSTRNIFQNSYLQFLSTGYLFIGILDGFHTLTYKGMHILDSLPLDASIHIWLITRFMEAATFLAAFYFAKTKKNNLYTVFGFYLFITLISIAIVYTGSMPTLYTDYNGLHELKITLEAVICFLFLFSIVLTTTSTTIPSSAKVLVIWSIYITILSEICFMLYSKVDDNINMLGHILKIISFYFVYLAVIGEGFSKPIETLTKKLKEKKEEYELIFNFIPLMILYKDTKNNIISQNKTASETLELFDEENSFLSQANQKYYQNIQELINTKKPVLNTIEKYETKSGEVVFEKNAIPVLNNENEVEKILIVAKDITKKVRLEEENRLNEALLIHQEKLNSLGEMINSIAHQWRQPLNALSLTIQDIELSYASGELTQEYIKEIVNQSVISINQMSKTIDEFRNYFKPDREKMVFSLNMIYNEIYNIFNERLKENHIDFVFDFSDESICTYKTELEQVIINIINNAIDAINQKQQSDKSFKGFINIKATKNEISIFNSGSNIDKKIIDKIFEPYFTTKFQSRGTGVSLYMSKQIIERHIGGRLLVANEDNGVKFTIILPAKIMPQD
ncbi:MAG: hypothetical protein QG567_2517 [Campylobacterota bacterium]|nr:hypothetical protein [Campylobacterota bacterium]